MKRILLTIFSLCILLCSCSNSKSLPDPPPLKFSPEELITINNTLKIDPMFLSDVGLFTEQAVSKYSKLNENDASWRIQISYDGMTFDQVCQDVESMNLDIHVKHQVASFVDEDTVKYTGYLYTKDVVNVTYFYEILWNVQEDIGEEVSYAFGYEMPKAW